MRSPRERAVRGRGRPGARGVRRRSAGVVVRRRGAGARDAPTAEGAQQEARAGGRTRAGGRAAERRMREPRRTAYADRERARREQEQQRRDGPAAGVGRGGPVGAADARRDRVRGAQSVGDEPRGRGRGSRRVGELRHDGEAAVTRGRDPGSGAGHRAGGEGREQADDRCHDGSATTSGPDHLSNVREHAAGANRDASDRARSTRSVVDRRRRCRDHLRCLCTTRCTR